MTSTTITTRSRTIDLATFTAAEVEITDIVKPLSQLCRFTGHTNRFYSVAEHSVRCSWLVPEGFALEALLHDAHEAYIGDIATPMKHLVPALFDVERRVDSLVREAFKLPPVMSETVRAADRQMLLLEARELMGADFGAPDVERRGMLYAAKDMGWNPTHALDRFTARFHHLVGKAA